MRSRYSAFVLGQVDYLVDTLHPSRRRPQDRENLEAAVASRRWLGLRILGRSEGRAADPAGTVEFEATYEESGRRGTLHERSRFVREGERWYYVSGVHDNLPSPKKPKRNEPCWCGSGKKYKKCHG